MSKKPISVTAWIIFIGYLLTLGFFHTIDVYHQHFFKTGSLVVFYNVMRIVFIAYLGWLFYALGNCILKKEDFSLASFLQKFFIGIGAWQILLLALGFAGLYRYPLMVILSTTILAFSLSQLTTWLSRPWQVYRPGWLIVAIPALAFLMTKGLYPAGGHDYYTHYFHFYKQVIETGSIMPNEVWYHFFYSKGAGLFFLSMLLTDPLAPQLATTALMVAGAAIIFDTVKNSSSWRLFPWLAVAIYLTLLIYTPGPIENMHQGGWGDLEKPHEPAAIFMLAIIWLTIGLAKSSIKRAWGLSLLFTISALVIMSPPVILFAGSYLFFALIYFCACRLFDVARWLFAALMTAGVWLAILLSLNYLLTGIPQDQGLFTFWPFINFDKVNQWGVLFELLVIHWLKTQLLAQQIVSSAFIPQIINYLRLDIWWPLLLVGLFAQGLSLRGYFNSQNNSENTLKTTNGAKLPLLAFGSFLLLTVFLSFGLGRDQYISFYRFTSFTYAPMLCFCLLLFSPKKPWLASIALFTAFGIILHSNVSGGNFGRILNHGFHFAAGKYSLAQAYRNQQGWPGRMPWGGIYPAAEIAWSQTKPNSRIWSMNVHSYCMLPDCRIEGFQSYRLIPHGEKVYFGDPKEAKALLQQDNLNYFFIANSLQLTDPLPLSPLFSPAHIAHYLGIAWTDGDNTLLTWKEDAVTPIDSAWLARYNRQINASASVKSFPYSSMRSVFDKTQHAKIQVINLPWNSISKEG